MLELQDFSVAPAALGETWTSALSNADGPDLAGAAIKVPRRPRKPRPEEHTMEVKKLPRYSPRCFTCTKTRFEKSSLLPILCKDCEHEVL